MELCKDGHREVCYEGRSCPACDSINDLEGQLQEAREKIESLEEEIEVLSSE